MLILCSYICSNISIKSANHLLHPGFPNHSPDVNIKYWPEIRLLCHGYLQLQSSIVFAIPLNICKFNLWLSSRFLLHDHCVEKCVSRNLQLQSLIDFAISLVSVENTRVMYQDIIITQWQIVICVEKCVSRNPQLQSLIVFAISLSSVENTRILICQIELTCVP